MEMDENRLQQHRHCEQQQQHHSTTNGTEGVIPCNFTIEYGDTFDEVGEIHIKSVVCVCDCVYYMCL